MKNSSIDWKAEFKDRKVESKYFEREIRHSLRYIKAFIITLCVGYTLLIIPDYFNIHDRDIFISILINRVCISISLVLLYYIIKHVQESKYLFHIIILYEIIVSISFCLIFYQYENPDFIIQTLGVILIILLIFILPNKWMGKNIAAVFVLTAFFSVAFIRFKYAPKFHMLAIISYVVIITVLSSINSFILNKYERIEYADKKELELLSNTDPLTGIFNRAKLNREIEKCMKKFEQEGVPFSIIMFDIDDFKAINDTYGHLAGDKALIDIVNIVKNEIKGSDIFFRWGGEEFVVLLKRTDKRQAIELAEKLRTEISEFAFVNPEHITCSFGVVTYRKDFGTQSLMSKADELLYKAKREGKNRVES